MFLKFLQNLHCAKTHDFNKNMPLILVIKGYFVKLFANFI
jgi:hypothetical protein